MGYRHTNPYQMMTSLLKGAFILGGLGLLAACDQPATSSHATQPSPFEDHASPEVKRRQADFLNRIRDADPDHRTIDRAMINDRTELGLILDRTVEMDKVPELMKTIIIQMAAQFPGEDLNVIAYAPSSPPRKIGTGHLDAASHAITYAPAQ